MEFNPQGTLAERMRAGSAGIPGFVPKRGSELSLQMAKSMTYIVETGITADLALVKAWKGHRTGNLVYGKTARNCNPVVAGCGRFCVAEVDEVASRDC